MTVDQIYKIYWIKAGFELTLQLGSRGFPEIIWNSKCTLAVTKASRTARIPRNLSMKKFCINCPIKNYNFLINDIVIQNLLSFHLQVIISHFNKKL